MVVSNYLKRQLVSGGIDGAKILVNQNGANTNHFNPNKWTRDAELRRLWGVPDGSFVFGYVGGMECFRKLPLVVKIFSDFAHDHPSAHLVMIGSGSDAERIADARLALPAELRQRIHLPGPLPYENAPLAMASFDCAIFPFSNPYGSPQKLFEYLAMELPVLGPEVPAVTEIFKDTYHMRLAIQDGSNLRTLFEEMLQNPGKNRQMAACGRNLVVGHYTWDANARRLYDFLKLHLPTHQ
jgi:glycosyltransferase involved in cell wall biosynthesis